MPWIESHTVLIRHTKIKSMARLLSISRVTAMGHIHCFWHTAIEQCEDGDLSNWSQEKIADAAEWEGDPKAFFDALLVSVFVDKSLLIHDWLEYSGRYLISKYKTSNHDRLVEIWAKYGKKYGKEFLRKSLGTTKEPPPYLTLPYPTLPLDLKHDINPTSFLVEKERVRAREEKEKKQPRFSPPSIEEVKIYCDERQNEIDPESFFAFYESKGWLIGNTKMKSWKSAIITWEKRNDKRNYNGERKPFTPSGRTRSNADERRAERAKGEYYEEIKL